MPRRIYRAAEITVLVSILLLAGYLRLMNVSHSPGWYSDEGTILNITQNLLEGRWQYMAINQSTLIAARLPLFPLLLAGASRICGPGIGTLRTLTGALGVLSVGLVYLFVRQVLGRQGAALALISALILAIYPSAILYSRFGFSYNLLPALALLSALWIWKYQETDQKRWMILACSMIGIGALSDIVMLTIAIPLFLVILIHRARDIPLAVLITLLPFIIFASTMMASAPEAFLFDAQFTLSRTSQIPLIAQFPLAVIGFGTLPIWDPWLAESVSQSRGKLGDRWLDCYLTSPVWRFAISAGLCGESAWVGVIMPSVDKVGRYYPMTLGAQLIARDGFADSSPSRNGRCSHAGDAGG